MSLQEVRHLRLQCDKCNGYYCDDNTYTGEIDLYNQARMDGWECEFPNDHCENCAEGSRYKKGHTG